MKEEKGCFPYIFGVIAVFVLLFVLLSSCGSHRSSIKQDTTTIVSAERLRKDSVSADKKVQVTESSKATESAESYEVNYDTDKPTDPVTGKPPIKSEKWTGTNKKSENDRQENINEKENSVSDESTFFGQQEDVYLEDSKQKNESTILKQIGWAGVGIALLIISCIAVWLVYKKKKNK